MKYFNEIYQAAKNRDQNTLRELFKKGACIDTRFNDESLITPAGLLAKEGDVDSARYLVDFFGANPIFVAQGLLMAENKIEADKWLVEFNLDQNLVYSERSMKFSAAIHKTAEEEVCPRKAKVVTGELNVEIFNDVIKHLDSYYKHHYMDLIAHGGHIYLLEAIFKDSGKKAPAFAYFSQHSGDGQIGLPVFRLQTEKLALHALSFIKSKKFLKSILQGVIDHGIFDAYPYDIEAVIERARKINAIMTSDNIGFSQALAICDARNVNLPPLMETSLGLFKVTKHFHTDLGTHHATEEIKVTFGLKS